jgi:hypothetical protein
MLTSNQKHAVSISLRLASALLLLSLLFTSASAKAAPQSETQDSSQADNSSQTDSQTQDSVSPAANGVAVIPTATIIAIPTQQVQTASINAIGSNDRNAGSTRSRRFRHIAQLNVAPAALNFGTVNLGKTSSGTLTLSNLGSKKLSITQIAVVGTGYSINRTSFPITLDAGGKTSVNVSFAPGYAGNATGQLTFDSDARDASLIVVLAGTGASTPKAPTPPTTPTTPTTPSTPPPTTPTPPTPTVIAPVITSEPASKTIPVGQTATFSVANTGTAPIAYQWMKNGSPIGGATSSSYTTPVTTISDNSSQFTVSVSNSANSVVSSAAVLTVNGTYILNASTSSLNFGSVDVSSSTQQTVTLTNSGSANVIISNVLISGAGFNASGVSAGTIVAAGKSVTLMATFSPASTGSASGSINIASNASNGADTISLSGTGASAAHSVTLNWTASTSSVTGYNVYVSTTSGGSYSRLTSSPVSNTTYTDSNLDTAQTRYYVVTSVDSSGDESPYSNQATAVIP